MLGTYGNQFLARYRHIWACLPLLFGALTNICMSVCLSIPVICLYLHPTCIGCPGMLEEYHGARDEKVDQYASDVCG